MSDMEINSTRDITAQAAARRQSQVATSTRSTNTNEAPKIQAHEYYSSPHGEINAETGVLVMQIRDSKTGAVINQYPSEKVAAEYNRSPVVAEPQAQAAAAPVAAPVPKSEPAPAPAPSAAAITSAPTPSFTSTKDA